MNFKTASKARCFSKDNAAKDTISAKEKKIKTSGSSISVQTDVACPICQEPVGQRTPEGKTESWSQLPCGHQFGSHCIKHWLGMVADDRPCCPICRRNASHLCGHPVLPELIAPNRKARPGDGGGAKAAANKSGMLQYTNCVFCRSETATRTRKKKRLKPWRFLQGCWRLVRHGRIRERHPPTTTQMPMFAYFPHVRDVAWERWWSNQEPRNA